MTDPGKITVTFFDHYSARFKREVEMTLPDLREMIETQTAESKGVLPWVKLAVFGNVPSEKKCLRHDANVERVTGCEADYDAEKISLDEAKDKLEKAGVTALIYTSASHTPERPRYRILCPFSEKLEPAQRAQMVARLNGLFHGALAPESFTLSQAFYYGHLLDTDQNVVAHRNGDGMDVVPGECRVEVVEGQPIDRCDELDRGAIGKSGKTGGNGAGDFHADYTATQELVRRITSGESLHPSVASLAGKYARQGWPIETCIELVGAAFTAAEQPRYGGRWQECITCIGDIYRKEAKRGGTGGSEKEPPPVFDPWERYIVPEFPLHVLSATLRDYVTSQSAVIGCDPAALAMCALTAASGAIDHRCAVKMMRNGNWWEHPRLWTLLVGPSSYKKTPPMNAATVPLEIHQDDLRRDYAAKSRDYEARQEAEDGDDSAEEPEPPPRYVVWDSTPEMLGQLLTRSDKGLLVKRDEFSGWIGSMEKYSSGSHAANYDRSFYLKAYDGGPYSHDRVSRGEVYIGNLSVSLLGGIQPAKLAEMKGLTSDGLLQRFMPVMMRAQKLPLDVASDEDDWGKYHRLIYRLITAEHQRFLLSDDALAVMNDLRGHLHELGQASGGLADGFQAFVGKLDGVAGRLTVVLHMVEMAERDGTAHRTIGPQTVRCVRDLIVDFILPHAREFYCGAGTTGGEMLRRLASWVLTSSRDRILASDLTTNVADCRGLTLPQLHERVSPFVACGWLRPDKLVGQSAGPQPARRTRQDGGGPKGCPSAVDGVTTAGRG